MPDEKHIVDADECCVCAWGALDGYAIIDVGSEVAELSHIVEALYADREVRKARGKTWRGLMDVDEASAQLAAWLADS